MGREAGMKCNFKSPEKKTKEPGIQSELEGNDLSAWDITEEMKKMTDKIKLTNNNSGIKRDFIYVNERQTKKNVRNK